MSTSSETCISWTAVRRLPDLGFPRVNRAGLRVCAVAWCGGYTRVCYPWCAGYPAGAKVAGVADPRYRARDARFLHSSMLTIQ